MGLYSINSKIVCFAHTVFTLHLSSGVTTLSTPTYVSIFRKPLRSTPKKYALFNLRCRRCLESRCRRFLLPLLWQINRVTRLLFFASSFDVITEEWSGLKEQIEGARSTRSSWLIRIPEVLISEIVGGRKSWKERCRYFRGSRPEQ